ncbi:MAG TPA: hypothetical protein VN841_23440 [Bryobacteraceae bacterium]|nr:hypothetical protein [Bryobacteraceae bacterium]
MKIVRQETQSNNIDRQFGSEADVERMTGRKRRTLQKDRCFGRGFPFYRFGRQIRYDLQEVRELILAGRVEVASRESFSVNARRKSGSDGGTHE